MKSLTVWMLGLTLGLGSLALAQESKKPESKPAETASAPAAKKKHRRHKKAPAKGAATQSGTSSAPKPTTK